jgi:hypothetical protein
MFSFFPSSYLAAVLSFNTIIRTSPVGCVQVIAALYIIYTHLYPIKISRFLFDVAATAEIVPLLLLLLLFYF